MKFVQHPFSQHCSGLTVQFYRRIVIDDVFEIVVYVARRLRLSGFECCCQACGGPDHCGETCSALMSSSHQGS